MLASQKDLKDLSEPFVPVVQRHSSATKVAQLNNHITIENIDARLKGFDARLKKIEYMLFGYER